MRSASVIVGYAFPVLADVWIWPPPQSMSAGGDTLSVSKDFRFLINVESSVLSRAAGRYEGYIGMNATGLSDGLQNCSVSVSSAEDRLVMQTSYRYALKVANGICSINADTVFGAAYGMESLYQIAANESLLDNVVVTDFPDYVHRGVMIDSGRRFWPVPLVKNTIDMMSFNKMNVLHLHASDMCRFAVESKLFPELTGSLAGVKAGHYTQDDIRELVGYARDRGVRIVPEFDMPGHAACFIPMEPRGVELCNRPGTSSIPNWCSLKARNGTATWDLMPRLALEMAELFDSEVYHIGGDEASCNGCQTPFEAMLLNTLTENGYRGMGWSEVEGVVTQGMVRNDTIIHSWSAANNASDLATRGVAAVDSRPGPFYLGHKTQANPTKAGGSWTDLGKARVPEVRQHLLLGGEVAFWTDPYCYVHDCVKPNAKPSSSAALFGPDRDLEFSRSASGLLWPTTNLAAGSFWHYGADIDQDRILAQAWHKQNALAAWRGVMVCPPGCDCTMTSVCGEPLIPPLPPSPPAPSNDSCIFTLDTGVIGSDIRKFHGQVKEECCAACLETDGCAAMVFDPLNKVCHLKRSYVPQARNDGSLAAAVPTSLQHVV